MFRGAAIKSCKDAENLGREIDFPSTKNPFAIPRDKLRLKNKGKQSWVSSRTRFGCVFLQKAASLRALASLFIYTLGHFFKDDDANSDSQRFALQWHSAGCGSRCREESLGCVRVPWRRGRVWPRPQLCGGEIARIGHKNDSWQSRQSRDRF